MERIYSIIGIGSFIRFDKTFGHFTSSGIDHGVEDHVKKGGFPVL